MQSLADRHLHVGHAHASLPDHRRRRSPLRARCLTLSCAVVLCFVVVFVLVLLFGSRDAARPAFFHRVRSAPSTQLQPSLERIVPVSAAVDATSGSSRETAYCPIPRPPDDVEWLSGQVAPPNEYDLRYMRSDFAWLEYTDDGEPDEAEPGLGRVWLSMQCPDAVGEYELVPLVGGDETLPMSSTSPLGSSRGRTRYPGHRVAVGPQMVAIAYCGDAEPMRLVQLPAAVPGRWDRRVLLQRAERHTEPRPGVDVNVVLLLMDAMSRAHFNRSLPRVQQFLHELSTDPDSPSAAVLDFERYHIIGTHSPYTQPQLLLGHACATETRDQAALYSAAAQRARVTAAHYWPQYAREFGYVRAAFSDVCQQHLRVPGTPVLEHYCLPELVRGAAPDDRLTDVWNPDTLACGEHVYVEPVLQLATQFDRQYRHVRRLLFVYLYAPHASMAAAYLRTADAALTRFLRSLDLARTLVVLTSDHGVHYGPHLRSEQGRLEHRLPPLVLLVPRAMAAQHPAAVEALRANQARLVTAWDLHHTLKHLFRYPAAAERVMVPAGRANAGAAADALQSRSLLEPVPADRSCAAAGIDALLCVCTGWTPVQLDRPPRWLPVIAQHYLDREINDVLARAPAGASNCRPLHVHPHWEGAYRALSDSDRPAGYQVQARIDVLEGSARFELVLDAWPADGSLPVRSDRDEQGAAAVPWVTVDRTELRLLRRLSEMGSDARQRLRPPAGMPLEYCVD